MTRDQRIEQQISDYREEYHTLRRTPIYMLPAGDVYKMQKLANMIEALEWVLLLEDTNNDQTD